jgi:ATP-binding cassette, subfamily F, member 3
MLQFQNLALRRGKTVLFSAANGQIHPGQKVGITGRNGTGKSSLFGLIQHQLSTDEGSLDYPPSWAVSVVEQETPALKLAAIEYVIAGDQKYTHIQNGLANCDELSQGEKIAHLHAELDAIDGYSIQSRAAQLMHGLGFVQNNISDPVASFSGGWRMRLNLARALIQQSDLLLLDEPTNHLDLDAVIWLESWLSTYPGTLLLISHDRTFLDNIVNQIINIENNTLSIYSGDYSSFESKRAAQLVQQQAKYEKQQAEINHIQHFIDRFKAKASKAKQAQSRVKALSKIVQISQAHIDSPFSFAFTTDEQLPQPLITINQISFGYESNPVLSHVSFSLMAGDRIALLGPNGAGKSTLIKLLAGEIKPGSGEIVTSPKLKIGYFAQHQLEQLCVDDDAFTTIQNLDKSQREQQVRDYLGRFAFLGDKVFTPISALSGGEKARLVLATIVFHQPHLLLLDEPTNHLDIEMRHAICVALQTYAGGVIIVSHDRHLLSSMTDQFFLVDQQRIVPFKGDLNDYQKWAQDLNKEQCATDKSVSPSSKKQQRQQKADNRSRLKSITNKIKQLEKKLAALEIEQQDIELQLGDEETFLAENKAKMLALLKRQTEVESNRTKIENEWLAESEKLEEQQE